MPVRVNRADDRAVHVLADVKIVDGLLHRVNAVAEVDEGDDDRPKSCEEGGPLLGIQTRIEQKCFVLLNVDLQLSRRHALVRTLNARVGFNGGLATHSQVRTLLP